MQTGHWLQIKVEWSAVSSKVVHMLTGGRMLRRPFLTVVGVRQKQSLVAHQMGAYKQAKIAWWIVCQCV